MIQIFAASRLLRITAGTRNSEDDWHPIASLIGSLRSLGCDATFVDRNLDGIEVVESLEFWPRSLRATLERRPEWRRKGLELSLGFCDFLHGLMEAEREDLGVEKSMFPRLRERVRVGASASSVP
ncbi:MAG: hypothetical protein ACI9VS_000330 [Candidatus Binatia bacterium]